MAEHPFFASPQHLPFSAGESGFGALLIHGFPGTPAELRPLAGQLVEHGIAVSVPLLAGMGSDIARLGATRRIDWLAGVRAAWRDVQRTHARTALVGYSMGGALAMLLAAESPPGRLVLIAPFWRLQLPGAFLLPVLKHLVKSVAPFGRSDFRNPKLRAYLTDIAPDLDLDDPDTVQAVRTNMRLHTAVLDELRRLGRDAYQAMPKVRTPMLVLQGRRDTTVPPAATRKLATRAGGPLRYIELDGGHHMVRLNEPNADEIVYWTARYLHSPAPRDAAPGRRVKHHLELFSRR